MQVLVEAVKVVLIMQTLLLSNTGHTIVDDEDYEKLLTHKWWKNPNGYAYYMWQRNKKRHSIFMHRLLLSVPEGLFTDHINGDKLDNRRCNLRVCTLAENKRNHGPYTSNTSGFTGVSKHRNKWSANIAKDYKIRHLGSFDTKEEAALAYDKAALELFGSFARLNFCE